MPIRADGLNLEGFLPEPNINPNVQQRGVPTLAESLMMAAQPVTGRVEHFLNDPVQQASQSLLMGGPMAAINPVKAALGLKEYTRMKNILNLPRPMKNVPDSLLGFAKNPNNQKGFSDFNFKHNRKFRIKFDDGTEIVDEINGLNKPSAVERAIRNWSGAVDIEDLGQVE